MSIKKNDNGWMRLASAFVLLCLLTACVSTPKAPDKQSEATQSSNSGKVVSQVDTTPSKSSTPTSATTHQQTPETRIGDAITSPLNDLNLVRTEIPEVLANARKAPYAMFKEADCAWLASEIHSLDRVLGLDIDTPQRDSNGNVIERGAEELGNAAVNALKGFTEGVVPFRAWIRRLTGADRHAKDLASAGVAGVVRRAYLKGVAHAKTCPLEIVK